MNLACTGLRPLITSVPVSIFLVEHRAPPRVLRVFILLGLSIAVWGIGLALACVLVRGNPNYKLELVLETFFSEHSIISTYTMSGFLFITCCCFLQRTLTIKCSLSLSPPFFLSRPSFFLFIFCSNRKSMLVRAPRYRQWNCKQLCCYTKQHLLCPEMFEWVHFRGTLLLLYWIMDRLSFMSP